MCHADELEPMWGEAALVGGSLVGVVLLPDGSVRAFSNTDPRTGASVMARGIVGSRAGAPTIASPLHKDVFDLVTGACATDAALRLPIWRVRVVGGTIEVAAPSVLVGASHGTSDPAGRQAVAGTSRRGPGRTPELPIVDAFVDVQDPTFRPCSARSIPRRRRWCRSAAALAVFTCTSTSPRQPRMLPVSAPQRQLGEWSWAVRSAPTSGWRMCSPDDSAKRTPVGRPRRPRRGRIHRPLRRGGLSHRRGDARRPPGPTRDCVVHLSSGSRASRMPSDGPRDGAGGAGRVVVATYLLAPGYFADLAAAAGGDLCSRPLLVEDAAPPAELVAIVLDRHDAATRTATTSPPDPATRPSIDPASAGTEE